MDITMAGDDSPGLPWSALLFAIVGPILLLVAALLLLIFPSALSTTSQIGLLAAGGVLTAAGFGVLALLTLRVRRPRPAVTTAPPAAKKIPMAPRPEPSPQPLPPVVATAPLFVASPRSDVAPSGYWASSTATTLASEAEVEYPAAPGLGPAVPLALAPAVANPSWMAPATPTRARALEGSALQQEMERLRIRLEHSRRPITEGGPLPPPEPPAFESNPLAGLRYCASCSTPVQPTGTVSLCWGCGRPLCRSCYWTRSSEAAAHRCASCAARSSGVSSVSVSRSGAVAGFRRAAFSRSSSVPR